MNRRRTSLFLGAAFIIVALAVATLLEPNRVLVGLVSGDDFFRGRPSRYWREILRVAGERNQIDEESVATFNGQASAIPVLTACARDPDRNVRWPAVALLGRVARLHVHDALPSLRSALSDDDIEVRLQAVIGLGNLGPNGLGAAPVLAPLVKDDPEPQVRFMAEKALWQISRKIAVEAGGWQRFESPDWGFSAMFPSPPEKKKQPSALVEQLTVHSFTAAHGVTEFVVAVTEYPPELLKGTDAERLDVGRDLMLFGLDAKLVEEQPYERGEIKGREITAEKTVGDSGRALTFIMRNRVFWLDRRQYQVLAVYNPELAILPAVEYFLDSFELPRPVPAGPEK